MKTLSAVLILSSCLVGCGGGGSSSPTSSSENTPTQVEPVVGTGVASEPVKTPDQPTIQDTSKNSVPNENPKKDQVVVNIGSPFDTPKDPINNQPDPLNKSVTNPTPVVENNIKYVTLNTDTSNFEQSTFDNVKFQ